VSEPEQHSLTEPDKAAQIRALSNRLRQQELLAEALKATLAEIHDSTAWKITAPVRAVQRFLSAPRPTPMRAGLCAARWKVSVVVLSYNHADYIAECLDSILAQKGFYAWEIIVGDDCSTDATPQILRAYRERHAQLIQVIAPGRNEGFARNLSACLKNCTGDFVAICEGDDYWTDEFKLQRQLEFLQDHPACSMCFCAFTLDRGGGDRHEPYPPQVSLKKDLLRTEDLIPQNPIANLSSCMYRAGLLRGVLKEIWEFGRFDPAEWIINLACGRKHCLGYLRQRMSAYRIHEQGTWSGQSELGQWMEVRHVMPAYNEFLGHEYDDAFERLAGRARDEIARLRLAMGSTAPPSPAGMPAHDSAGTELNAGPRRQELTDDGGLVTELVRQISLKEQEVESLRGLIAVIHLSFHWRLSWPIRNARPYMQQLRRRFDGLTRARAERRPRFRPRRNTKNRKISVVVLSFNQEAYIGQCMDGVLMQKGNFAWEVIVGDDCSTDDTPRILAEYESQHPSLIKRMHAAANLGAPRNLWRCLEACTGDYVAICEGDDYWTDAFKLQKQLEFLEDHPECPMCFSGVLLRYQAGSRLHPHRWQKSLRKNFLSTEDLIGLNYVANASSCLYRPGILKQVMQAIFEFNRFPVAEWIVNMAIARTGKIGFLPEEMSVYRVSQQGTWSGQSELEQWQGIRQRLDIYNSFLGPEYDATFARTKRRYDTLIAHTARSEENSAAPSTPP
jgi:glycosyltransferase involved in cell wall biosynthesis